MAVELKKFQAELAKIETQINSAFGDRKTLGDSEGNTKKVLDAARLAVGDRVQALKASGNTGVTLADFAVDAEVKKSLGVATESLSNFKAIEARKLKAHADIKTIYAELNDLAKRIDAEVADRKKKLFEPKSLPDMIKLGTKVRDLAEEEGGLKTESIKDIATATAPKAGAMEAAFKTALDLEIKKSAAIRANAAVTDLVAKFQPRLMKLRWDRANTLGKEAEAACGEALTAQKGGDVKGAKAKVAVAVDKSIELDAIVTGYNEAYQKNKSFLEQNPDHSTIFKLVSGLTSLSNRVLKAVQAAQAIVK